MAGDPSHPPPPPGPSPPPDAASPDEWRRWRREMRHRYGWYGMRGPGGWTWFWGVALILVGAYFLLKNLGLLDWLKGDVVWPVLIILLGLWMLAGRALRRP